jgi:hypothetical protein
MTAKTRRARRPKHLVVIGTGDMGGALATAFATRSHHRVTVRGSNLRSRSAAALIRKLGVSQATDDELRTADVVFVVVPWSAAKSVSRTLHAYRGIVVSVVVRDDGTVASPSAAERIAHLLPRARVVGTFTSIWSHVIRDPGRGTKTSAIVCSDDAGARRVVMGLARDIGLDAVNGGSLASTRYTEALGHLAYALATEGRYGQRVSFRVFRSRR